MARQRVRLADEELLPLEAARAGSGRCRVSNRERHASPVDRCGYLPREIFFGRFGFAGGFFSVWATDFGRFFPAT